MEYSGPDSIEELLDYLAGDDEQQLNAKLADLSNLSTDEVQYLEREWPEIGLERRRIIVFRLLEMAENNPQYNFDDIFRLSLMDEDMEIRCAAIDGLWENEDPSLMYRFIRIMEEDDSPKVRAEAVIALAKYTMLAELGELREEHATALVDALKMVLEDTGTPTEVWRRALEAAAPLSIPYITELIESAYRHPERQVQVSALFAMGKNCDESWLPILLKELQNNDNEMRYEAANACGEIGDEESVGPLSALINDPDIEVSMAAIQALGNIGGPRAREYLSMAAESENEAIQNAAVDAMLYLDVQEDPMAFGDL